MADEQETQEQETEEKPYVRMKREDIKALEAEAQRAKDLDQAKKELAMVKAGIDTDSKLGQLFFNSYNGELTTEALRKEAAEIGLYEELKEETTIPEEERQSTKERQQAANGSSAPDHNPLHPREEAVEKAKEVIAKGGKFDHAAGAYINTLVQRFAEGDPRAGTNRNDRYRRES